MAHTFTSPQRTLVAGAAFAHHAKLELTDPDGTWQNVSSLSGIDWLTAITVADNVDANTATLSASLKAEAGSLSLAPLRENSTVNRNAATAYAPFLDLMRKWRLSVDVTALPGDTPTYKEIGKGYYGLIDVGDEVQLSGRGEEAVLLDNEILEENDYSPNSDQSMEAVIQAMLDDYWDTTFGAIPTLFTPVATGVVMNPFTQNADTNLMSAIQAVAGGQGYVIRYRHDSSGVNRLTLYLPPREATAGDEDWSLGPTEYTVIPQNQLNIDGVRNYVTVDYPDAITSKIKTVVSPTSTPTASTARFGIRALAIDVSEDSQLTVAADVQAFADAIRSDLEFPVLEQQAVSPGLWFVQLCDYVKMEANGVHYDNDQYGGVNSFQHTIENGTITTTVGIGGQPKGGYKRWKPLGKRLPKVPGVPTEPPLIPFPKFGPGGVPGVIADYNADSMVARGHVNSEALTTVNDDSDSGHDLVAAAGQEPVLETNAIGTHAVFNLMSNKAAQSGTAFITPTAGSTVFAIVKRTGSHVEHGVWWRLTNTPTGATGTGLSLSESHHFGPGFDQDDKIEVETGSLYVNALDTAWLIAAIRYTSSTTAEVFVSGQRVNLYTQAGVVTATSYNPGVQGDSPCYFTLGNGVTGGGNGQEGKSPRMILYDSALSDADIVTVSRALDVQYFGSSTIGMTVPGGVVGDPQLPFDAATTITAGTIVTSGSGTFIALQSSLGVTPVEGAYWKQIGNTDGGGLASVTSAPAIANTETVVMSITVPANTLSAGRTYRLWARSTRAGVNATAPTYKVRIGPTTLTGNVAASLTGTASATADPRYVTSDITFRTIGASGTVLGGMHEAQNAIAPAVNTLSSTVAVDTTVANVIELTFISGNAANTYTFQLAGIEMVKG